VPEECCKRAAGVVGWGEVEVGCRRTALSLWNRGFGLLYYGVRVAPRGKMGTELVEEMEKQDTGSKQRMMPSSLLGRARARRHLLPWLVANVRCETQVRLGPACDSQSDSSPTYSTADTPLSLSAPAAGTPTRREGPGKLVADVIKDMYGHIMQTHYN
jgi:hypothetical protein